MKEEINCNAFLRYWESLGYNDQNGFSKELVKALAIVWSNTK